ncbi:F-box family protein [Striga asiatica]|uniref:F-box family protein n=1 Tax=Striga asiatica TaxID=4170 RepID=A0A5A7QSN2_STRAF|nr:F-box family protein [Striga asiatica]
MFKTSIIGVDRAMQWARLARREWGDIFDILKRPRLVKASCNRKVFMVGGLRSSYGLQSECSTILILRLDLENLEWEEAGRMPLEMYRCFVESSKFKVFGGGGRVCFSAKRVGRLALWEEKGNGKADWMWVDGGPGSGDGLCRGFTFEARLDAVP